jgi:hypothetical protein
VRVPDGDRVDEDRGTGQAMMRSVANESSDVVIVVMNGVGRVRVGDGWW